MREKTGVRVQQKRQDPTLLISLAWRNFYIHELLLVLFPGKVVWQLMSIILCIKQIFNWGIKSTRKTIKTQLCTITQKKTLNFTYFIEVYSNVSGKYLLEKKRSSQGIVELKRKKINHWWETELWSRCEFKMVIFLKICGRTFTLTF